MTSSSCARMATQPTISQSRVGPPESGVRLIAERLLRVSGIDPRDVVPLADGIDTGPGRLRRGEADAMFWSGGYRPTGSHRACNAAGEDVRVPVRPDRG